MSSVISPLTLLKVKELFADQKWSIQPGIAPNLSLFDKYCARLALFDSRQQNLIIELSKKFHVINLNEYIERFCDSFFCLKDEFLEKKARIFVYPLVDPYLGIAKQGGKISARKTKSANFLHYLLDAHDMRWISNKLIFASSIDMLKRNFRNDDSCLILIDDFIGSGKTAIDVCRIFLDEEMDDGRIAPNNVKIVTIAAQNFGMKNVANSIGIEVYSNLIMTKGISDTYIGKELEEKIVDMKKVEAILKIKNDYLFGWEQSEALITFLNKTPNNTFPVFWHETNKRVAPFPRYKVFAYE